LLESFKKWWLRRIKEITWKDRVKVEVLAESRNKGISCTQENERRLTIGHILRTNCLLRHVVEGKIGWQDEEETASSY